jgi:hypothetical protein
MIEQRTATCLTPVPRHKGVQRISGGDKQEKRRFLVLGLSDIVKPSNYLSFINQRRAGDDDKLRVDTLILSGTGHSRRDNRLVFKSAGSRMIKPT